MFSHLQPECNQLYSHSELSHHQHDNRAYSLHSDLHRDSALQHRKHTLININLLVSVIWGTLLVQLWRHQTVKLTY